MFYPNITLCVKNLLHSSKKFGRLFIYFEKGEPKETNYRIDIMMKTPSQEQLNVYHDCGWDIVANNGNFYIFSADKRSCITELHTDPIEQGFFLSELDNRLKNNLIIISIARLLFFGMMFSLFFFNDEPFLFMIMGSFVQQLLLVVLELYVFYSAIRNYVAIRSLKKSLLQGRTINHNENYRKARLTSGILAGIFLPLALLTVFIPFVQITKSKDYTLPEVNTNLPIIKLSDIEQNPKLMRGKSYYSKNVDMANRVRYDWSLLAPVQYEIAEHGIIDSELWEDKSGEYSPSITTRYYKLTFGIMAENITLDLISRYVFRDDTEIREIYSSELDKLYIAEDTISKQIFASKDNQVIYVVYYGNGKIEDIIPLVEENLLSCEE